MGVTLAVMTGLWLFSVNPVAYADNPAFLCKVALLLLAICNIALQHRGEHFHAALHGGRRGCASARWLPHPPFCGYPY